MIDMMMINGYHQFILCVTESSIQQTLLLSHQMFAERVWSVEHTQNQLLASDY